MIHSGFSLHSCSLACSESLAVFQRISFSLSSSHCAQAGEAPGLAGDTLRGHVFDALLKALAWPDTDDLDAGPVRLSAAGALRALLTVRTTEPCRLLKQATAGHPEDVIQKPHVAQGSLCE